MAESTTDGMDTDSSQHTLSHLSQAAATWQRILELVRPRVSQQAFDTWFSPLVASHIEEGRLTVHVPNAFFIDWLEEHYQALLRTAIDEVLGPSSELRLAAPKKTAAESRASIPIPTLESPSISSRLPDESHLNSAYTFANFVVGSSNQFAHAACKAVAGRPAAVYNPLFIHGGVGLGKTHLMQAIGNYVKEHNPRSHVVYVSSEKFTTEMISSIQRGETLEFKRRYRGVDILLIDDIQFLAGKESTQEEFFHTFNSLYDASKQIVITSDRPPKELPDIQERLVSRFNGGLVTDIQPPDLETRVAILKNKAELEGTALTDDVALLIANAVTANIRELEGTLVNLLAYSSLSKSPITVDLAKEILRGLVAKGPKRVHIGDIQRVVASHFSLPVESLRGKRRTSAIAFARQVAMYLARQLTDLSFVEIGSRFGGRDHTTVLYACEKVRNLARDDAPFRETLEKLISTLTRRG